MVEEQSTEFKIQNSKFKEQRTENKVETRRAASEIQNSKFKNKEQIKRDSFDSVIGKLNHRLGMTPTAQ